MSFPRYPEYRASGVEWLGEIPAHWAAKRLSYLFQLIASGTTPSSEDLASFEGNVCWVTTSELRETLIEDTEKKVTEAALKKYSALTVFPPGTLLIALYGATIGRLGTLAVEACTNQACCAMALPDGAVVRFIFYSLLAAKEHLLLIASGGGQPNINQEKIRSLRVGNPPLDEQSAIANFLDAETGKIDALVAEQEKLIALLKEKQQALVSHAVTKGLDLNVPMKDSGIQWLGEVPDHWEVRKLSSLSTKITNGFVGPTRDILVDDGVRYLQSLHVKGNVIRFDTPYYVRQEWSDAHAKSILEVGDVLIVQTGDIGQVAVVTDEFAGCNCHALIIVTPKRDIVTGEWLSWVFNADFGFHSLLSIQTGALHPHLNCGNVKDLYLPVPPMDEQARITSYIAEKSRGFDELTSETQRAIELLKERRSALVSAAVTGKIDVRNYLS